MSRTTTVRCDWPNCTEKEVVAYFKPSVFDSYLFPMARLSREAKRAIRYGYRVLSNIGWESVDDGDKMQGLDYCPKHAEIYHREMREAYDNYVEEVR